jgi:hypothetical protein
MASERGSGLSERVRSKVNQRRCARGHALARQYEWAPREWAVRECVLRDSTCTGVFKSEHALTHEEDSEETTNERCAVMHVVWAHHHTQQTRVE